MSRSPPVERALGPDRRGRLPHLAARRGTPPARRIFPPVPDDNRRPRVHPDRRARRTADRLLKET